MRDLAPLLAPASIAIVGASGRANSLAAQPLANLRARGFPGRIYPVNPQQTDIAGLACYPSLEALPGVPDLALIVTPAGRVLAALEEAAKLGVRASIVISSGFAETGPEGARQQRRMGKLAKASGMIVCGPNSIGVLNYVDRIPMTFTVQFAFLLTSARGVRDRVLPRTRARRDRILAGRCTCRLCAPC